MHALSLITIGALVVFGGALPTSALARDRDVTIAAPLERAKPDGLDKANGVGPRFKFFSAPPELSATCAGSVRAHVNEAGFVDYPGARTAEEFRSRVAGSIQLKPSEAKQAPVHKSYALSGEGQISGATCANLKASPGARGHCVGIISGSSYTIVYSFNPTACRFDNLAVARALESRLSIGNRDDREPEPDCATKLEGFVADIDDVLARNPRSILDVYAVLNRHFPLHGCTVDVVSGIMKKSKYFRSVGMSGPKTHVFSLSSETTFSRGIAVSFGLTNTGDSQFPFAMWSPPFP